MGSLLTPKGRLQGEERRSPCQQTQAASLISEGYRVFPQFQTSDPAPRATHDSC